MMMKKTSSNSWIGVHRRTTAAAREHVHMQPAQEQQNAATVACKRTVERFSRLNKDGETNIEYHYY